MGFDVRSHKLICKHSKVSEAEKEALLTKYDLETPDLPKILQTDPAISSLGLKAGDIVKIERESKTAGDTTYYRVVVDG